jgi:hypothetical protein
LSSVSNQLSTSRISFILSGKWKIALKRPTFQNAIKRNSPEEVGRHGICRTDSVETRQLDESFKAEGIEKAKDRLNRSKKNSKEDHSKTAALDCGYCRSSASCSHATETLLLLFILFRIVFHMVIRNI